MTATSPTAAEYLATPNGLVSAANGIDYAYREIGEGPPLVLLQHFRGNLDNWDPALIDELASNRRVVTFDNAGVGGSTGTTPSTIAQMAVDAIAFLDAIELVKVDILGFSIGSFVAQEIALVRPSVVRRLVLASSAPQGAAGMHGWAPEVIQAVGSPAPNPDGYLSVFFTGSAQAGKRAWRPYDGWPHVSMAETRQRRGRHARPSTTRCARGESRITGCCSGSAPSTCLSSSRTGTAIR